MLATPISGTSIAPEASARPRRGVPAVGRNVEALYYVSRLTSQAGQGLFFALLVVLAGPSSAGALGLGGVMVAMTVAAIALGPLGGSTVDRLGPRLALPTGAVLRLVAIGCAVAVLGRGEYAWAAAFVYSAASQVFSPAELALVSTIRRERPAGAHASLFALQFGGQVVGAFAFAPALFWIGGASTMLAGALLLYGAVVILSTVISGRLRAVAGGAPRRGPASRRSRIPFRATLRFIGREPSALYAVGLLAFVDVMAKCLLIAAPIYFGSELRLDRVQVAILAGTASVGVLGGLIWSGRHLPAARSPLAMRLILLATLGATFALTPLGDGLATLTVSGSTLKFDGTAGPLAVGSLAAMPAVLILGAAISMAPIVARSVLTATAPVDQQGRVFAAEAVLSNVLVVPALLLAALSTDLMSARATVIFIGVIGSAVFLALEYAAIERGAASGGEAAVPAPETV